MSLINLVMMSVTADYSVLYLWHLWWTSLESTMELWQWNKGSSMFCRLLLSIFQHFLSVLFEKHQTTLPDEFAHHTMIDLRSSCDAAKWCLSVNVFNSDLRWAQTANMSVCKEKVKHPSEERWSKTLFLPRGEFKAVWFILQNMRRTHTHNCATTVKTHFFQLQLH